jgi:thioredoxin reductase (NADPH)
MAIRADYDVVIVGSGPAGLTAGLYCGRAKLHTAMLEKSDLGGSIVNADLIENFPGFPQGISGADLVANMISQAMKYDVKFEFAEVTTLDPIGDLKRVNTTSGSLLAKAVIVAGGGRPKKLGIPGEEQFIGRGLSFCAMCDGNQLADREVAVIGGGDGGISAALYMSRIASKVTVIEIVPTLSAIPVLQEKAARNTNIEILCSVAVEAITRAGELISLGIKNVETDKKSELRVRGVFVLIGLDPETEYLHETVELDSAGFIVVTNAMETNIPGILAAGDIRKDSARQVITAAGDGATAALSAEKYILSL